MLAPEMQYYIALRGTGAGRFVRINDAIVLNEKGRPGASFMDVISISDWIVLGPNRVEVEISSVSDTDRAELLLAAKSSGSVQTIRKCGSLEDIPAEIEFQVGPSMEGAAAVAPSIDAADEDQIRAIVLSLHHAISHGQIDTAMALLNTRVHRAAERRGIDLAEAGALQRRQIETLRDGSVSLLPVSADAISLTPVSRGRLVRAEVEGRAPICATLKDDPHKMRSSLPLTFQRGLDGWFVAR